MNSLPGGGGGAVQLRITADITLVLKVNAKLDIIWVGVEDETGFAITGKIPMTVFLDALQQAATMAEGNR